MNTIVKVGAGIVVGFIAGFFAAKVIKKHDSNGFEVVTDEEQLEFSEQDLEKRGKTIEDCINDVFSGKEEPQGIDPNTIPHGGHDGDEIKAINTQKTAYWDPSKMPQYDTLSGPPEEEPVVTDEEEFDPGFIAEAEAEAESDGMVMVDVPDIEEASTQEFYHWASIQDGEFKPETLYWYAGDDKLVDDEDQIITNPQGYLGFDYKEFFEKNKATDGDPDAIYIKNNKQQSIYEIVRYQNTYSVVSRMGDNDDGGEDDS